MNWTIDKPLRIGDLVIAAIVELQVLVEAAGPTFVGTARKKPLVILQIRQDGVTGTDVNGHGYDEEEIELLYPGAISQVRSAIAEMGP